MGFLGAMAGLGKGVTDYATTLKEKEKQDWDTQQESVKYERSMNMQRLRDKSLDKRQSVLLGHQATQGDLTRGATADLTEAQLANTRELQTQRLTSVESEGQKGRESIESQLAAKLNLEKTIAEAREKGMNTRFISGMENDLKTLELKIASTEKEGEAGREVTKRGQDITKDVAGLNIASREKISQSQIDAASKRIKEQATANQETYSANQVTAMATYKAQKTADLESQVKKTDDLLTKMYETTGYKNASQGIKDAMELQVLVNNKLDFKDLANSPGVGSKGEKLKGITGKQMELALDSMRDSPTYKRMDAAQQWNMAQARAMILANPTLAQMSGTQVITEGNMVKVAKMWNEGEIDGLEILKWTPDTLAKVVDTANAMKAMPSSPERGSGGAGGVMNIPQVEEMKTEIQAGVKGRAVAEWWTTVFSRDPKKLMAGDEAAIGAAQKQAAMIPEL